MFLSRNWGWVHKCTPVLTLIFRAACYSEDGYVFLPFYSLPHLARYCDARSQPVSHVIPTKTNIISVASNTPHIEQTANIYSQRFIFYHFRSWKPQITALPRLIRCWPLPPLSFSPKLNWVHHERAETGAEVGIRHWDEHREDLIYTAIQVLTATIVFT